MLSDSSTFFHTLLFGPLCLGYISQLVDTVVGYFCITFLSFAIYSVLCLYLIQPIGCHANKIIIIILLLAGKQQELAQI